MIDFLKVDIDDCKDTGKRSYHAVFNFNDQHYVVNYTTNGVKKPHITKQQFIDKIKDRIHE